MEEIKETDKSNENVRVCIVKVDSKNETVDESLGLPRFTRTGKISYAKTRVYTQRYRKEWENMTDFKDWLTSVPDQNTKAYCKFCDRTLHAHRLSLLKHMCTLKHQRAAAHVQREQSNGSIKSNNSHEIDEIVEDDYEECSYIVEDEIITEGEVEEMVEESEIQEGSPPFKKIRSEKEKQSDPLEEAMAHVNSDYLSENDSEVNMQNESLDHEQDTVYIKSDVQDEDDISEETTKTQEESKISSLPSISSTKSIVSNVDNSKKMFIITSNGKPLTVLKGSQLMLNSSNNDNYTIAKVLSSGTKIKFSSQPTSSTPISKVTVTNNVNNSVTSMSTLLRKKSNIVSTYVLDTSKGAPVSGMQVSLYKLQDGKWTFIEESMTNANGICDDFAVRKSISSGRYKLHYDVEKYYNARKIATIYPFIEIVFDIKNPNSTYHTPLYLSPFSYSTFKDTSR